MRMLMSLIGYAATATVITILAGIGYLMQSDRLDDERMFRIVAVLHGVNTDPVAEGEGEAGEDEVLNEEPSLIDQQRVRDLALRDNEVRLESLRRHRIEFDRSRDQLVSQTARFNELAEELEQRIEQENATNSDQEISNVVRDLKQAEAELAKDLLLRILNSGTTPAEEQRALEDTVRLIKRLPATKWEEILNTFEDEDEKQQLHRLHMEALGGGAKQRVLDEAVRKLQNRDFGS